MLNQAKYIRLLILFYALSMVQRIKLFKINFEVCKPIIATSIIKYPYSKFLTNIAAQKNDEASALLKRLTPPLHIASGAPVSKAHKSPQC